MAAPLVLTMICSPPVTTTTRDRSKPIRAPINRPQVTYRIASTVRYSSRSLVQLNTYMFHRCSCTDTACCTVIHTGSLSCTCATAPHGASLSFLILFACRIVFTTRIRAGAPYWYWYGSVLDWVLDNPAAYVRRLFGTSSMLLLYLM